MNPLLAREVFFLLADSGRVAVLYGVGLHGIYTYIDEVGVDVCSQWCVARWGRKCVVCRSLCSNGLRFSVCIC